MGPTKKNTNERMWLQFVFLLEERNPNLSLFFLIHQGLKKDPKNVMTTYLMCHHCICICGGLKFDFLIDLIFIFACKLCISCVVRMASLAHHYPFVRLCFAPPTEWRGPSAPSRGSCPHSPTATAPPALAPSGGAQAFAFSHRCFAQLAVWIV